jgi:hypothetical protein
MIVVGHIHEGAGQWQRAPTTLINASLVGENYQPIHAPWLIEQ